MLLELEEGGTLEEGGAGEEATEEETEVPPEEGAAGEAGISWKEGDSSWSGGSSREVSGGVSGSAVPWSEEMAPPPERISGPGTASGRRAAHPARARAATPAANTRRRVGVKNVMGLTPFWCDVAYTNPFYDIIP